MVIEQAQQKRGEGLVKQYLRIIEAQARKDPRRILFNEGEDDRILAAIRGICRRGTARPLLLGPKRRILQRVQRFHVPMGKIDIIDPSALDMKRYAQELFFLRKHKGMTLSEARRQLEDLNYLGCMLVHCGDADGMVSGAVGTTASLLRPALQILRKKGKLVSSFFFMKRRGSSFLFADPSVNISPTPEELARIAKETADTARKIFNIAPRVAMLSFSTHGSADHELARKVAQATAIARTMVRGIQIDGELQADAALMHDIYRRKCKTPVLRDRANVLIFPDLNSANIAYKLVQWLAGYEAVGPIIQGLRHPVNDLSRGCTVQDIIDLAAITTVQAQYHEKKWGHRRKR